MSEARFDVVLKNRLQQGAERGQVVANLCSLFRIQPAQAQALLEKPRTVVKRDIDRETAETYRETLRRAGVSAAIVTRELPAAPAPSSPPAAPAAPTEQTAAPSTKGSDEYAASSVTAPASDGLGLAEPGAIVDDSPRPSAPQIDTDFAIAASEGPMDETPRPANPGIEADFDLAADDEPFDSRPRPEAPEFDLSHMQASESFDALDQSKKPPPPEIDSDHFDLKE